MKKHPIWFIILGIIILVIPTLLYLIWLMPKLTEEYNALLSSAGIIGGAGFFGTSKIPINLSNSSLFKLASNSFTTLTVILLVQEFIMEIIILASIFIISFIIFKLLIGAYKNAKRRNENAELAEEIARIVDKTIK